MKEAKEYFKKEWGTSFIGATLKHDKGLLELTMEDLYKTMQSYAEEQVKKSNLKQLEEAYKLTNNPMVGKTEYLLNHILNKALSGKDRIKGIPSSNKIAQFVIDYLKEQ